MKIQTIDYTYELDNVKNGLEEGMRNLSNVIAEQTKLIKLIEDNNQQEELKQAYNSFKEMVKEYSHQKDVLAYRLECLAYFQSELLVNDRDKYAVSTLLEILGVSNKEAKSVKERIENKESVISIER